MTDRAERLKAATKGDREIDRELFAIDCPTLPREVLVLLSVEVFPEYTSSLDAALALVERVLPGWHIMNLCEWDDERLRVKGPWMAQIKKRGAAPLADLGDCRHAPTAPLAVLIALLSALPADSLGQEETGK